ADGWGERQERWCRAGQRGVLSRELLDLRVDCADQRLREVEASLALARARQDLGAEELVALFDGLTPLATCDDGRALRSILRAPEDQAFAQRLAELRREQAEIHALWAAGDLQPGLERARILSRDADELGWGPMIAESLYQEGLFEDAMVDDGAEQTLVDAALTAAAARHDRVTAQSLIRLVRFASLHPESAGPRGNEEAEAANTSMERYAARAGEALEGLGDPALLRAELLDYRGLAARQAGDYPTALEFHRQALSIKTEELGAEHPSTGATLLRLGNLYDDLDRNDAATQSLEQALSIHLRRFGPWHPAAADIHSRLGTLALEREDRAAASEHHRQALEIRLRVFGEKRVPVAESLTYLGELEALEGDFKGAKRSFTEALSILKAELGPTHPHVAVALSTVARAWTETGRDLEAVEPYGQALELLTAALGDQHPQVGVLVFNLATVRLRLGGLEDALAGFRRSAVVWSQSLGPEHPLMAQALTGEADCLERLGRPTAALETLGRVAAMELAESASAKWQADAVFINARAQSALGADPEVARALGEEARGAYLAQRADSSRELAELEAWLALLPRSGTPDG
ncbi:MAG: tetratricopeptide repeat protein, partial [Acidobacteriota bacterium]